MIENIIDVIAENCPLREEMEQADNDITYLLNKIKRKIEGLGRRIPYSAEKVRRNIIVQYWKA